MNTRRELPLRRRSENFDLSFGGIGQVYEITAGFHEDGTLGEVFINFGKSGAQAEGIARDGAVLLSLALQYGVPLITIKNAITRDGQGQPSTIIGAVVDRLEKGHG